ncbi:hypothetical protein ACIBCN_43845 [Nocardia sp. NPDC051052]|uniref:hypothetical protein n=1 Tax=Nocardia sp. NPDC051052 TaxID=3364322 RepID=UPI0037B2E8C8
MLLAPDTDHRGIDDGRMLEQHPLDFGAVDVLTSGDDHVSEPVCHEDIPRLVDQPHISGTHPTVGSDRLGRLDSATEIPAHPAPGTEPQLSVGVRRPVRAVVEAQHALLIQMIETFQEVG